MKNSSSGIICIAFIILIIINTIFSGINRSIYLASDAIIMLLSLVLMLYIKKKNDARKKMFFIIILWIVHNLFLAFKDFTAVSFYIGFQHISIIMYFFVMIHLLEEENNNKMFLMFFRLIHYAVLLFLVYQTIFHKSGISQYEHLIYIGLATIIAIANRNKKINPIVLTALCVFWAYVSYVISARAQIFSFIIFMVSYFILKQDKIKEKTGTKIFILYYSLINLFPLLYTYLSNSSYRTTLDNFALKYTTSRFFSGRDLLWSYIYERLVGVKEYIFGLGFNEIGVFVRENISLHNLYVTLIAEGGLIMVILFGLLLLEIWKILFNKKSFMSRITMSFLIVILYKQTFDISLIENNFYIALIIWTSIAIGMKGFVLKEDELK